MAGIEEVDFTVRNVDVVRTGVLPLRRFGCEEAAQCRAVCIARV
jgi:hypothetical protein